MCPRKERGVKRRSRLPPKNFEKEKRRKHSLRIKMKKGLHRVSGRAAIGKQASGATFGTWEAWEVLRAIP